MNILGDSITWGYSPITGEQIERSYSLILKEKLGLKELRNYGINSSILADNQTAFEAMCNRYKNMDDNADIVIVFGGTNDYGRDEFGIELGNITDVDVSTVYGALNNICVGLKQKYPNSFIFFITPLKKAFLDNDCNLKYATNFKNNLEYSLEDVSNAIKEVCGKYNISFFDLYNNCDIYNNEICKKYLPDGLHPTEEYHQILANKIYNYIVNKLDKNILIDENNSNYIKKASSYSQYKAKEIKNDLITFYYQFNHLKDIYRQGWVKSLVGPERILEIESVADHSWSVAMLAISIIQKYNLKYDVEKCMKLSIIHELGEIYAGDFTPKDNITKEQKHEKEKQAISRLLDTISFKNDFLELWEEFEKQETKESIFIKQLDKLECIMQSTCYNLDASYIKSGRELITLPFLKEILEEIDGLSLENDKPYCLK